MFKKSNIYILFILFHLVGLIGFCIPALQPLFKALVPWHLMLMYILVLIIHSEDLQKILYISLIIFILGYLTEVMGVHTKFIFGDYKYGNTLGLKLLEVPLTMGINWFLLIYSIAHIFSQIPYSIFIKSGISALLMVFTDIFIEPVAQHFDYWQWYQNTVPLQNYIAWLVISFALFIFYFKQNIKTKDKQGSILYICQCVFFIILRLYCL